MAPAETDYPAVYAVLLAAGVSRRFGGDNKLLEEIDGSPLVRRVAKRLLGCRAAGVIVVTGFEADRIAEALCGLDLRFADNLDHGAGLSSSLARGVAAIPEAAAGAMIVLADMPDITPVFANRLLDVFAQAGGTKIVYPASGRRAQGNPVIWPARYFAELQNLSGDAGAKQLIARHEGQTLRVPARSDAPLRDIDTPGDLEAWRAGEKNR